MHHLRIPSKNIEYTQISKMNKQTLCPSCERVKSLKWNILPDCYKVHVNRQKY